jgi:hypothetical protein
VVRSNFDEQDYPILVGLGWSDWAWEEQHAAAVGLFFLNDTTAGVDPAFEDLVAGTSCSTQLTELGL